MAYVYRHIRLDKNEPFYIGIGSDKEYKRADLSRRDIQRLPGRKVRRRGLDVSRPGSHTFQAPPL